MKYVLNLIIFLSAITSCTKHAGDHEAATPSATLNITNPSPNQVISKNDSIRITGTATAAAVMHGYDVYLTRQSDTTRLLTATVHDHNTSLLIDKSFAPQPPGNYEAHVLLKLDHDGHTLHKFISFKTQ